MVMKFYGMDTTNAQRAILPLFEKGVDEKDFKLVEVDLKAGEQRQPHFLTKQPFGLIPYFEDDDIHLYVEKLTRQTTRQALMGGNVTESRAIARFLAEKYEDQGVDLLGKTMRERSLINQWAEVEAQNFNIVAFPMCEEIFLAHILNRPLNVAVMASGTVKVEKILDVYEKQLSKNKYLAGDSYSLADLFHAPSMNRLLQELKEEVFKSRMHVYAWGKDITSRPAFKKTLETSSIWTKE